ncbi:MAG: type II toxin-antitoxin system RelE/ParE family toxin [Candidatus Ozemobacteraceae bacterium]
MTRLFSIHEAAEDEINEAADFYDLESNGLGSVFLDEIESAIEQISHFPNSAPILKGRVRMLVLRKFPISVAYSVLAKDQLWYLTNQYEGLLRDNQ